MFHQPTEIFPVHNDCTCHLNPSPPCLLIFEEARFHPSIPAGSPHVRHVNGGHVTVIPPVLEVQRELEAIHLPNLGKRMFNVQMVKGSLSDLNVIRHVYLNFEMAK